MKRLNNKIKTIFTWKRQNLSPDNQQGKESIISLNPLTLSFKSNLEQEFLDDYYKTSILQINIAAIAGLLLFISFFPFDYFLVPDYFLDFLLLRLGMGGSIVFSSLLIINLSSKKGISQPVLCCSIIMMGLVNIFFMIKAFPDLNTYYYVGLILINFWGYVFLKLRYVWAALSGFSLLLIYVALFLFLKPMEPQIFLISTAYLFASNISGLGISYAIEYYNRKSYYQNIILQRSLQDNINLHKKVNETYKAIDIAEEKLTLQSKALESAANSIVIFDRSGNIIWCNNAFTVLTGYEQSELIGQNPRILKSGQHTNLFYKNLWSTILSGKVWSGEIINKKKDGTFYYEEMVITPVTGNGTGKVTNFIAVKQDISLRKEMEEELLKSEKRFRGLFEHATMGLYRSNIKGELLLANNALIKMLGFDSLEELRNRDQYNSGYVKKNQREIFLKKLENFRVLVGFESQWRKKDGSIIHIRESARLYTDYSGEKIFEGTVEDITISKQAEAEIKESRERLQVVVDNLYDAIFIHDIDGKIINVNNKVLDLYKVSKEEIFKLTIEDISGKDNPMGLVADYWQKVVNDGESFKFEWKAMRPIDKYLFDVEVFLSRISFDNKDYVLANVRDITEQKEANRRLLITQKAVELNSSPIFWINNKAKIVYANRAATLHLGFNLNELKNMRVEEVDPNWTMDYWINKRDQRLKEGNVALIESVHVTKDGKMIPVEINASILEYENEEIINDITERKKVAEKLIEAKEKAEQSDRLKSEFLAGMSHEIRTPINTILNFISLIRSDLGDNTSEDVKSSFEMIDSGSRRLIRTIDSILNMSQLQSGSYEIIKEPFSVVDDILEQLLREFSKTAEEKGLNFRIENNSKSTTVFADKYTISQLFINLIDNALKYTKEGEVSIVVESDDENIIIKICDTGIGISEEFLPTLFEPFIQEEMGYTRSFEGTGLGLALVKNYVKLNNGSINVKSKKGSGSVFTVKLEKYDPVPVN